ncbi:MAG: hypothetical protein NC085_10310 [Muribaculaceae bacterium]|nr:hypothetical protein [Muribaculaceae bacterium]
MMRDARFARIVVGGSVKLVLHSELAEFLGVDRSALSRELGRMQDEK